MGDGEALQSYKICQNDRNFGFCPSLRLVEVASAELLIWGAWGLSSSANSNIKHIRPSLYQNSILPKIYNTCKPKKLSVGRLWKVPRTIWKKAAYGSRCWGTSPRPAGLLYTKRSAKDWILSAQQCREVQKNCFLLDAQGRSEAPGAGPKPCFGLWDSSVRSFSRSLPALHQL